MFSLFGQISFIEENYKEAVDFLEKALVETENPDESIYSNLGAPNIQINEYEKAEEYLNRAIEISPLTPDAYKNIAELYRKTGGRLGVAESYEKYLELVPDDMNVMQSYAIHMDYLRKFAKASQLLKLLNEKFPNVASFFFLRAQAETELKNHGEAIVALQRAVQLVDSSYALSWLSKSEFEPLHNNPHFKEIVDLIETDIENQ